MLPLNVMAPDAKKFPIKVPNMVVGPKWTLEPGEEFMALWGSGYDQARAYMEIEHRGKIVKSFWTEAGATQQPVKLAVTEAMRGGFTLHVTMVRENRAYLESRHVDVPWTNKNLTVKWEHFVSKLEPGQKETWTAVISGPDAKKAVAEMVAALYDESLDAYLPHNWPAGFGVFRQDWSTINFQLREHGQVPQPGPRQLAVGSEAGADDATARCRRASPWTCGDTAISAAAWAEWARTARDVDGGAGNGAGRDGPPRRGRWTPPRPTRC